MLFMAKSALCIGIVSVLAIGTAGSGGVSDAVVSGGREVAGDLGRACAASSDCVALGSRIVSAAIGQPGVVPREMVQAGVDQAPMRSRFRKPRPRMPNGRRPVASDMSGGRPFHASSAGRGAGRTDPSERYDGRTSCGPDHD